MGPRLAERIAFRVALPVVLAQGLVVRQTAPRFAAAAGPTEGSVGEGESFRLLAIGDSIIAGVGVERLEDGMPGQLAKALSCRLQRRVEWRARGMSGIGAREIRRRFVPGLRDDYDCVFLSAGVNDVTALRSTRYWRHELDGLVGDLRAASPRAVVIVSGLPPLHGFPLLPQPLRAILGMRARTFDVLAEELLDGRAKVMFVPSRFEPDASFFAADGYHPSAESCRIWAASVAERVLAVE